MAVKSINCVDDANKCVDDANKSMCVNKVEIICNSNTLSARKLINCKPMDLSSKG